MNGISRMWVRVYLSDLEVYLFEVLLRASFNDNRALQLAFREFVADKESQCETHCELHSHAKCAFDKGSILIYCAVTQDLFRGDGVVAGKIKV